MVTGGRREEPRERGRATGSGKKKKEREQMKVGEGGRKEYSGNKKRYRGQLPTDRRRVKTPPVVSICGVCTRIYICSV